MRVPDLKKWKPEGRRVAMLTAYDAPMARTFDEAGVDVILVGDSLGMTVLGYDTTIPVTLDDIAYHTGTVARVTERALVVADMPFLTYQTGHALENAGELMRAGAAAVKVEGGGPVVDTVKQLVESGIPVMGHVGLTPQSVHQLGGLRLQGRSDEAVEEMVAVANDLEAAGAFSIVVECVPHEAAKKVPEAVSIPTIGIGAGPHWDGQVLVAHDMLGMQEWSPKFAKRYAELGQQMAEAAQAYCEEVRDGSFPADG